MNKMRILSSILATFLIAIASNAFAAGGDNPIYATFIGDRLEHHWKDGKDSYIWDVQGWVGDDYNKLWLKSEGEKEQHGKIEEAEIQALYSRNISSFWDFQIGYRHDFRPNPSRNFFVVGFQGLAPYWFEVDTALFISDDGDISATLEVEYDLLLTQRLILQPRLETNLALQDVRKYNIGSGINNIELGLRLRYEISRKFAPYIGISWDRKIGETSHFMKLAGEDNNVFSVVAGLKLWF